MSSPSTRPTCRSPMSAGCTPSDRSWRVTGSPCSRWICHRWASPYWCVSCVSCRSATSARGWWHPPLGCCPTTSTPHALLNSVTKLDRVPVSLKTHAKSWVPGSQFAVLAGPNPQLIKVGPTVKPMDGPEFATDLLVAKGQSQSEWVQQTLAPAWKVQAIHEAALPSDSPGWWGTGKLVEFAAYLPDISVLYQLVASVRREICHWCGMELIGDRCGFCTSPLHAPENRMPSSGVLSQGAPAPPGS